jgi:hypothetical protein
MKLYLCGPMTGQPDYGVRAFGEAAKRLRDAGYEVVSPAELWADHIAAVLAGAETVKTYRDYMAVDLPAMLGCDGVAVLPGALKSPGASLEMHLATACGIRSATVPVWLSR